MAIDMRGARSPAYISAALVKCLQNAQKKGFGNTIEINLTNPRSPLSSPSIDNYLQSVKNKGQFICLIFDQFEELYSKPELYNIFHAAKDIMIDVASYSGAMGLGFAWKTDSTTQHDHPAYYTWHELADHRREFKLKSFNKGEISKALTAFEKEAKFKLPAEIRHQISHSCQGFPWFLKKLCIHLYENSDISDGNNSTILEIDVATLFQNDLQPLELKEKTCLNLIASKAPADWSEIIEHSGVSVVNSLINKRLIVRSGDRLNIYWDIFRDYLLTNNAPIVPFNYIPSTDISSMIKVSLLLNHNDYISSEKVAAKTNLKERTVWNIGADLVLFGVAERSSTNFKLHKKISSPDSKMVLNQIRNQVERHSLKIMLYRNFQGQTIRKQEIADCLKQCFPDEKYTHKTWNIYVNRFLSIFLVVGFLVRVGSNFTVHDSGGVVSNVSRISKRSEAFTAMASPAKVCKALEFAQNHNSFEESKNRGYRNALHVLGRFNLIDIRNGIIYVNKDVINRYRSINEAVWSSAKAEFSITICIKEIRRNQNISGNEIGKLISDEFSLNWTAASMTRTGAALKKWAMWIIEGSDGGNVPPPPGRTQNNAR